VKALRTLLKLANSELETLRRALAESNSRLGLLDERIRGHEQSIVAEQRAALRDYETQRAYGGFAQLALQGRRALHAERAIVVAEIERLRELVAEAHIEARKFERLIELDEARELKKREKREADQLDEFATLRAGRANPR